MVCVTQSDAVQKPIMKPIILYIPRIVPYIYCLFTFRKRTVISMSALSFNVIKLEIDQ